MLLKPLGLKFKVTCSTANNGITSILNTTLWGDPSRSSTPSTAIGANIGTSNQCAGLWLVVPYILCTANNVTLTFQTLINGAWASSLDVPTGYLGGANTITANASAQSGFSWRLYGDSNVFVTNGVAGPTILDIGTPYLTNVDPGNLP
jgi:hypothetical protein